MVCSMVGIWFVAWFGYGLYSCRRNIFVARIEIDKIWEVSHGAQAKEDYKPVQVLPIFDPRYKRSFSDISSMIYRMA